MDNKDASKNCNTIYVSSPVGALVEGLYEENITFSRIREYGDMGLGTFNDLDGEMVMIDNVIYQIKSDGCVSIVEDNEVLTPFSCVTFYQPLSHDKVSSPMAYADLLELINSLFPSTNLFYAIRIDGEFSYVKTRSVPKQENYTPLVEAAKNQPEFEFTNIKGTLAGFYTPSFMSSINVPGLHLHFLSDDRCHGGHLLHCDVIEACIGVQFLSDVRLSLPLTLDYLTTDLNRDMTEDLHKAET